MIGAEDGTVQEPPPANASLCALCPIPSLRVDGKPISPSRSPSHPPLLMHSSPLPHLPFRVDGKLLPRIYDQAVIKKSEHRGCCYLNGTERIPVKSKVREGAGGGMLGRGLVIGVYHWALGCFRPALPCLASFLATESSGSQHFLTPASPWRPPLPCLAAAVQAGADARAEQPGHPGLPLPQCRGPAAAQLASSGQPQCT